MDPIKPSLGQVFDNIRLRHLEQLQTFTLIESPVERLPGADPSFLDLEKWTKDSQDEIKAAIANCIYGGSIGSNINFNNTFMAFMESAVMYLRNIPLVLEAVEEFRKGDSPKAVALLKQSTERIEEIANMWGMKFIQICDLLQQHPDGHSLLVGPFCGAFVPEDSSKPFIGVAFKGTSVVGEVWNDLRAMTTIKAPKGILWEADLAQGFYIPLFTKYSDIGEKVPYDLVENAIGDLYKSSKVPDVRVHVTGHSLGGAYASLCYGQLTLRDSSIKLSLGDLYTFGSPRVARQDFAVALKESVKSGSSWRIANNKDVVPEVPSSIHSDSLFIHVDALYKIYPDQDPQKGDTEIGTHPPPVPVPPISLIAHFPDAYYKSLKFATTKKAAETDTPLI